MSTVLEMTKYVTVDEVVELDNTYLSCGVLIGVKTIYGSVIYGHVTEAEIAPHLFRDWRAAPASGASA